jgi:cytochrome P450
MFATYNEPSIYDICHQRHGLTYESRSLFGKTMVNTIAIEILQVIFSQSKDFGIQPLQLSGMEYFCGQGFLTTDGPVWQHSRKLSKPSFNKSNISNLQFLSHEIDRLIHKMPGCRLTIDLQPLLLVTVSAVRFTSGVILTKLVS